MIGTSTVRVSIDNGLLDPHRPVGLRPYLSKSDWRALGHALERALRSGVEFNATIASCRLGLPLVLLAVVLSLLWLPHPLGVALLLLLGLCLIFLNCLGYMYRNCWVEPQVDQQLQMVLQQYNEQYSNNNNNNNHHQNMSSSEEEENVQDHRNDSYNHNNNTEAVLSFHLVPMPPSLQSSEWYASSSSSNQKFVPVDFLLQICILDPKYGQGNRRRDRRSRSRSRSRSRLTNHSKHQNQPARSTYQPPAAFSNQPRNRTDNAEEYDDYDNDDDNHSEYSHDEDDDDVEQQQPQQPPPLVLQQEKLEQLERAKPYMSLQEYQEQRLDILNQFGGGVD
ncbi:hypothetical protein ACA910_014227 [Epithemia clementina (nom. ined.)]